MKVGLVWKPFRDCLTPTPLFKFEHIAHEGTALAFSIFGNFLGNANTRFEPKAELYLKWP